MKGAIVKDVENNRYGLLTPDHASSSYGRPVFVPLDDQYQPTGEPARGPGEVGNLLDCGYVGALPMDRGKREGWTGAFSEAVIRAGYRFAYARQDI
jgi:hypothetical protein